MRTDFIQQRDPGDENDYWYVKMGYGFWPWCVEQGFLIVKKTKDEEWVEKNFDYDLDDLHGGIYGGVL